jgi:hemerythrin-like domain-containing protein
MDTVTRSHLSLIETLTAEHAELLPEIENLINVAAMNGPALDATVGDIGTRIGAGLDVHIEQEDKVLFPAYAEAVGDVGLVGQFSTEHREILRLRDELMAAHRAGALNGDDLAGIALRFADLLTSHMMREDAMLFPTIRETLD